jgi:hypothetical protein
MKKLNLPFLFFILFSFISEKSEAQSPVIIGTGTVSNLYGPIYIFSNASPNTNSWNMSIYDQTEIIAAGGSSGTITKISWYKSSAGAYLPYDASFEIFIKTTSQTDFPTAADFDTEVIGATQVYSNTAEGLPVTIGWVDFQLNNPFVWNGTDNIMILTRWQRVTAGTAEVDWQSTSYTPLIKTSHSFNSSSTMGTLYTTANRPNIALEFGAVGPNDAGVLSIDSTSSHCVSGAYPVYAKVKNFGTDPLNSFTLYWKLDGISQTPIPYSTTIAPSTTAEVFLGNLNYTSNSSYEIFAYTSDPNGLADDNNNNDTIYLKDIRSSMSGNYTVGGVSPDFANFAEACTSLNTSGICGPVTFSIRSGTYTGQINITKVNGSSAVNTVTFNSELNDSSSVIITTPSSATLTNNYLVKITGASNITFKNLTFERSGTDLYSNIIDLSGTDNCVFVNNRFIGPTGNGTVNTNGSRSGIFANTNTVNSNLIIQNNYFKDNGNGIWLNGKATQIASGLKIEHNVFETFYVGAFLYYQDSPIIMQNTLTRNDALATVDYFGISLRYCTGYLRIGGNKIAGKLGNYGIRLRQCTSVLNSEGLIYNNFVQVGGSAISYGIAFEDNSNFQNIYHNSINCTGTNATTGAAIYFNSAGILGMKIYNNILANTGGGYAYSVSSTAVGGILASENNDIYSSGPSIALWAGLDRPNLIALRNSSNKDFNSVSVNPLFISASDLHTAVAGLSHAGNSLAGIAEDIDAQPRNGFTPDIGADEFTAVGIDKIEKSSRLNVYPNPVNDKISFKLDGLNEKINIIVQDLSGRILIEKSIPSSLSNAEIQLDVHQLSKGTYIIDCISSDKKYTTSFIKL